MAWLKATHNKMGLSALATMLGVDEANLVKAIEGKRAPSKGLLENIAAVRLQSE
jgi:hypothetical protein